MTRMDMGMTSNELDSALAGHECILNNRGLASWFKLPSSSRSKSLVLRRTLQVGRWTYTEYVRSNKPLSMAMNQSWPFWKR
jgi:hypothetical protein